MSEFVMGAEMRLTDNFSQTFSEMSGSTNEFRSNMEPVTDTLNSFSSASTSGTQATRQFADTLEDVAAATDTLNEPIQQSTRGISDLIGSVKTFAKTKISEAVNNFKEFKTRVTGGETGIKGLWNATKSFAKTSLTAIHNGLKKVGEIAVAAGKKITSGLGTAIKGVSKGLLAATAAAGAAVGAVLAGSINVGKDFEAGMSTVAAISGATGGDLKALEDKAKQMGATTSFSATEAAKAMEYMAMAGWKTEQMVGGIDGIMNLAAASGEDLGTTSDIVTDALTAFNMTAEESGRFADVLAAASSNANTNVSMMGATFKYVAPVAGALGYSVEDMGLAIGLMANAGIKGEMAGTQLRATLSRMAKPTKESAAAMDALGLSITNSDGSMKDFDEVMVDMRKGMSGLSEDQKASYAAMLGGQEAMSGLLAIANASEADFQKLTSAIDNSAGAAANMAAIRLDNLQGDITILKSGLEGLGIEIYQGIQEPLRSITQEATAMVGGLSDAFKKGGFAGLVGEVGNVFAKVVTKVAGAAPKIVNMAVSLVDNLVTGIADNAPMIADGAAKAVTAFINGAVPMIPRVLLLAIDLIADFANGIIANLPQIINTGIQSLTGFINGIVSRLPMLIQTALQLIQAVVSGLIANLPLIIQSGITLIVGLVQGIVSMLPSLIQMALQLIMALVQGLIANLPLIINAAVQLVMSLVQGIVTMLPMIIQSAIQLIIALFQGLIANLPTIIQAAVQIVVALAVGLIQAIPQLIAAIPQLISAIVDTILNTNWLQVGWDIVKGIGKGLFDGIKGIFGGAGKAGGEEMANGAAQGAEMGLSAINEASAQTASSFTANLQPDYSAIGGYGMEAGTSLSAGLTTGAAGIDTTASQIGTDAMLGLSDGFTMALPDTLATVSNVGLESVTGLSTGMTDNLGLATTAATTVTTGVTDTFKEISLYDCGTNAMQGFVDGLSAMRGSVMAVASDIASSVKTTINSALDIHSPSRVMEDSGEFTGQGFVNGIMKMIDRVRSAAQGLSDGALEPFATQATSVQSISPSGVANMPAGRSEGLKIAIENIILQDVGDKDPKALVAEILQLLYDALSGADEVLSAGEMGALL